DEVREAEEERARTQKRPAPEEAETFGELRAQRPTVALALLLERRPHRDQRERRERVRGGVDEKRQRARGSEERAAERRPGELHGCVTARLDTRGSRQLAQRHDCSQRAG